MGSTSSFRAQDAARLALQSTLFSSCFKFHLPMLCLMPWNALGTLVVMNTDERDPLQAIFSLSTPFNAHYCIAEWWSVHDTRARVG